MPAASTAYRCDFDTCAIDFNRFDSYPHDADDQPLRPNRFTPVSAQRLVIPEIEQRDNEEPAGLFAVGSVMPTGGGPDLEHQNPRPPTMPT